MKILGINHLGLASSDPTKTAWFLNNVLGLSHLGDDHVIDQRTMTQMYELKSQILSASSSRLEILIPDEGMDSPVAKYLNKKGPGIHHVAITVDNLDLAIKRMAEFSIEMIDLIPRNGAHNTKIAFIHPRSTGGILVELVEEQTQI